MSNGVRRSRAGFTLTEVLVAVSMVGVLAAVVIPTVINQVAKGEVSRLVQDLQNVGTGVQLFRADLGRFPTSLNQLAAEPASGASVWSSTGGATATVTPAQIASWDGPYIEKFVTDSLETGFGGWFRPRARTGGTYVDTVTWGGSKYVRFQIHPVSESDAKAVSLVVDGEEVVTHDADAAGRVRWNGNGTGSDTLIYISGPMK
jgi:prepilin-type N-terminal cleavage/methylation domain-containing protein